MNKHIFRVIFSKVRGCLVVASELARASGKGKSTSICSDKPVNRGLTGYSLLSLSVLMAQGLLVLALPVQADIIADSDAPASQRPTLLRTDNGLPQVNIQTPSASGVSHNKFSSFDVGKEGVILNNARVPTATQQAGFVKGNPWLSRGEARVILNEVKSANPSQLQGFVEVAGRKADVIIANPAGITCNGCGFINADRATLSTGVPLMNNGRLEGFDVEQGKISIEGRGLNAAGADYTSLIARAVEVNADLLAQDLIVTTGRNTVSADSSVTDVKTSTGTPASGFAIDVAHLGGMYAGKIHLVATEAGVGVNNAGTLAGTRGGFTLSADGQLVNTGMVTAAGDLSVALKGDLQNSGTIYSQTDGELVAASVVNAGVIAAQTETRVDVAGGFSNSRTALLAAGLKPDASFNNNGNLLLSAEQLSNDGRIVATNNTGLKAIAGITNSHQVVVSGKLSLESSQLQNSDGALLQANALAATHTRLQNEGDIIARAASVHADSLTNSGAGEISAQELTIVADRVDNLATNGSAARIIADQSLKIAADQIVNQGGATFGSNGSVTIGGALDDSGVVTGAVAQLDNQQSTLTAGTDMSLTVAGPLNNQGQLFAGEDLRLVAQDSLNNSGAVYARKELSLTVSGDLTNAGIVAAGADTSLSVAGQLENRGNATIAAGLSETLKLDGSGELDIRAESAVINQGDIAATEELSITTTAHLQNSGRVQSGKQVMLSVGQLTNAADGEMLAQTLTVTSAGDLDNQGVISAENNTLKADQISNAGSGKIFGTVLKIAADQLTNTALNDQSATIAARDRLDIGVNRLLNEKGASILSLGDVRIGGTLDADGNVSGSAQQIDNIAADIEAVKNLQLNASVINNKNGGVVLETVTLIENQPVREYQPRGSTNRQANKPGGGDYTVYEYNVTETEQRIESTDPARMLAGADLTLKADSLLNDQSHIGAGNNLTLDADKLENIDTWLEYKKTGSGKSYYSYISKCSKAVVGSKSCRKTKNHAPYTHPTETYTYLAGAGADTPSESELVIPGDIAVSVNQALAGYTGNPNKSLIVSASRLNGGSTVRTAAINPGQLTGSSLFQYTGADVSEPLFATDARFTNYQAWLTASYQADQLVFDPEITQRQLGDGYIQQQLVQQQITQLTGQRFLPGYNSNEEQFTALMDAGVNFAFEYDLKPGVALTGQQMSQLTSDIVWLVEQDIQLADGRVEKALVPQVYAVLEEGDLNGSGAILGGRNVDINLAGMMHNRGIISAQERLNINAGNVENIRGVIDGNQVSVSAAEQLANVGGHLRADQSLHLSAGQDITVAALERVASSRQGANFLETVSLDGIGTLTVTHPNASLYAAAGGDFNLAGGAIAASGEGSQVQLTAGDDINITPATVRQRSAIVWDSRNYRRDSLSSDIGATIAGAGDVSLNAGNDVNLTAAKVDLQGDFSASAGGDVRLKAGESRISQYEDHYNTGGGWLSKSSRHTVDSINRTDRVGTQISAQSVTLAGDNISLSGSSTVADNDVQLTAGNDVVIESAQGSESRTEYEKTRKSGIFSGGSFGITIGSQVISDKASTEQTHQVASVVGSLAGDVSIQADNDVTITASDLLARQGDITLTGDNVTLNSADDETLRREEHRVKQSGLTLALSGGAVDTIKTVTESTERTQSADDSRLKAVHAWRVNRAAQQLPDQLENLTDANLEDVGQKSGINLSLSLGSSSSEDTTRIASTTALGSSVLAEGDVTVTARGDAQRDAANENSDAVNGDIRMQGALVEGENITLDARDEIVLQSAENTYDKDNQSRSSSAGIGVSIGSDGLILYVEGSKSRGEINQTSDQYLETQLNAKQTASLTSGGDTSLNGAQVNADRIVADVGGDLNITSQQDNEHYRQRKESLGGKVGIGLSSGGVAYANVNASRLKADSDYQSVQEQSGLFAGEQGFDVDVADNTDLQGGAIVSEADASNNRLSTETLSYNSLHNNAEYDVESQSISVGTSGIGGGYSSDSGKASSTTYAAISDGDIDVRSQPGLTLEQLDNIKRSQAEAHQTLKRIFSEDKVRQAEEAMELTQVFAEEAYREIGNLYADVDNAEAKLREAKARQDEDAIALWETQLAQAEQNLPFDKEVAHALAGGLIAVMGGGNFVQGAVAAGTNELLAEEIKHNLNSNPALHSLAVTLIGGALGGTSGALISANADQFNRQLHPTEIDFLADEERIARYKAYIQGLEGDGRELSNQQALDELTATALQMVDSNWDEQLENEWGAYDAKRAAAQFLKNEGIDYRYKDSAGIEHNFFTVTQAERENETINLEHYDTIRHRLTSVLPESGIEEIFETAGSPVAWGHGLVNEAVDTVKDAYDSYETITDPETRERIARFYDYAEQHPEEAKQLLLDAAGKIPAEMEVALKAELNKYALYTDQNRIYDANVAGAQDGASIVNPAKKVTGAAAAIVAIIKRIPDEKLPEGNSGNGSTAAKLNRNPRFDQVEARNNDELQFIKNAEATFGQSSTWTSITRHRGELVVQRSDIELSPQNITRMKNGHAPFVKNSHGKWEPLQLHHVSRETGQMIEVTRSQNRYNNKTGGPLHIPGPGGPIRQPQFSHTYWRERYAKFVDSGHVVE
ncbi:MAG: hemagglutinin repeat-containing protein [Amphritea sp.]|nr:hemagglutinin repeat-containing protein [Amphritea sp.]